MEITIALPAECISNIISLTNPRDACRLSVVCRVFRSAADSDSAWENFLPSDYKQIIFNSVSDSSLITSLSKKDLYFHLYHNTIIINNGTMDVMGTNFQSNTGWIFRRTTTVNSIRESEEG